MLTRVQLEIDIILPLLNIKKIGRWAINYLLTSGDSHRALGELLWRGSERPRVPSARLSA